MDIDLNKVQKLLSFMDSFRLIERHTYIKGSDRKENDSEHTLELVMLCWYLATEHNKTAEQKLSLDLVMRYAIIHDLVEVYAGDIDLYSAPKEGDIQAKEQREKDSLEKIKGEFEFFKELPDLIEQYERQEDEESQFVKSLDKSVFELLQLRDDCRSWKELQPPHTWESISEKKQPKLKHPAGKMLWEKVAEAIKKQGGFYWLKK